MTAVAADESGIGNELGPHRHIGVTYERSPPPPASWMLPMSSLSASVSVLPPALAESFPMFQHAMPCRKETQVWLIKGSV